MYDGGYVRMGYNMLGDNGSSFEMYTSNKDTHAGLFDSSENLTNFIAEDYSVTSLCTENHDLCKWSKGERISFKFKSYKYTETQVKLELSLKKHNDTEWHHFASQTCGPQSCF